MIGKLFALLATIPRHKWKILLFVLCVPVFLLILFPLDDLGDYVSSQVSTLTRGAIYVRFDKMGISVVPQPGIQLKQVYIEPANMSALRAQELTLTPSFGSFLHQKPYGKFTAEGFMKGDVEVDLSGGRRSDNNRERLRLDVSARNLSLLDIREFANLPILLRGQLNLELVDGQIDPTFQDQPDVEVMVNVDKFEIPTTNLPIMGGLTVPEIRLGKIQLKGRMSGGRINLNEGVLGQQGDEIFGNVKMNMGLTLRKEGNGPIVPIIGDYTIELDLLVKNSFREKVPLLGMLDKFKTDSPDGARYKVKVSGPSPFVTPNVSAMH